MDHFYILSVPHRQVLDVRAKVLERVRELRRSCGANGDPIVVRYGRSSAGPTRERRQHKNAFPMVLDSELALVVVELLLDESPEIDDVWLIRQLLPCRVTHFRLSIVQETLASNSVRLIYGVHRVCGVTEQSK